MIIAVDFDNTLGDLATPWLEAYNRDYDDHLTPQDITGWHIHTVVKPECGEKIYDYLTPALHKKIEPFPEAIETIRLLRARGHRIVIATAGDSAMVDAKIKWLVKHGIFEQSHAYPDFINIKDKGLLSVDLLIDDGPHNCKAFKGNSILFNQRWNEDHDHPCRVYGWREIPEKVEEFQDGLEFARLPEELHYTERTRPLQCKAFREIIKRMYQVHLDKNADYSPANILGPGEIGLITRIWDKVIRLANLLGLRIEIASSSFEKPLQPKNEPVEDAYMDIAIYGIIGLIYRQGLWGK